MPMLYARFLEHKLGIQRMSHFPFSEFNANEACKVILIPGWVGQVCLLLGDSLSQAESTGCQRMTSRTYGTFQTGINGVSAITGANTLDIASIGIDLGLSTRNVALLTEAYGRVHQELTVKDGIKADGIRADGSFGRSFTYLERK